MDLKYSVKYSREIIDSKGSRWFGLEEEFSKDFPKIDAYNQVMFEVDRQVSEFAGAAAPKTPPSTTPPAKPQGTAQSAPLGGEQRGTQIYGGFGDLSRFPWKSFRRRGPDNKPSDTGPSEAGWIFADTNGAEQLANVLMQEGEIDLKIGETMFTLKLTVSRQDGREFINRTPVEAGRR